MRTLIVEDDFVSRLVLSRMLSVYGVCDTVVNGVEALSAFSIALAENNPYEVICMDIMMPEMDGKEALKIIRQREQEAKIPPEKEAKIVMISALDTPKDVIDTYYHGGCTSYIVKPIEKNKIIKVLKDIGVL